MTEKILIFITAEYPYGKGETFIENEMLYLSKSYDRIIIIAQNNKDNTKRVIPSNCTSLIIDNSKVSWAVTFFIILTRMAFVKEFFENIFSNPLKNKILFASIQKSLNILYFINDFIKNKVNTKNDITLYSYWLDDAALAIALSNVDCVKIARAHRWDIYEEEHLYQYLPARPYLLKRLHKIFFISQDGMQYFRSKFGKHSETKTDISRLGVPNGNVLNEFHKDNRLNIISCSNIVERKRVLMIAETLNEASQAGVSIRWTHVGSGYEEKKLVEKSRQLAAGNQLFEPYFTGSVSNTFIHELYREKPFDFLINLSESEGIPVSMMEAMSYGIPCIGTNVGGVSEIITDNYNGYLLPAHPNPKVVAQCILKYYQLPTEEKAAMRLNARKTWEEKYDAQKNYIDFIKKIKELSIE